MLDQIKPSNGGNKQALKKAVLRDGIFFALRAPALCLSKSLQEREKSVIFHFPSQLEQIRGILNIVMFKGTTGQ